VTSSLYLDATGPAAVSGPADPQLAAAGRELMAELLPALGPGTTLVLCGADGLVLACAGPLAGSAPGYRAGALWTEAAAGPNAIGRSLMQRTPAALGDASAAPILLADRLLGVLGVVTPDGVHPHTLALAVSGARSLSLRAGLESKASEALVHNRTLQELVETISDGFMAVDRAGRVTYLNRNGAEILGVEVREAVGRKVIDLVDFQPKLLSVLETGLGWVDREFFIRMGKKGPIHLIKSAIPVVNATGEVTGVIDTFREIKNVRKLVTDMVGARASFVFDDIICSSDEMRQVMAMARQVAASDSTALLHGESGTGKELFAQSIHNASRRLSGPFITVDCAAIPRELVESELFGYVEGAFTGARKGGRPGKFELAHGGTIFLDEIGEMPLQLQARLLRVLQDHMVSPLGGTGSHRVDLSVICATNRRVRDAVAEGNFREDLYYRLNGLLLTLPSLRERDDRVPLAKKILDNLTGTERKVSVSSEVLRIFEHHPWPGNIRQMHNVLRTALALLGDCPEITVDELPEDFMEQAVIGVREDKICEKSSDSDKGMSLLADCEGRLITSTLDRTGGNIAAAARLMGVSRNTLYRKLRGQTAVSP